MATEAAATARRVTRVVASGMSLGDRGRPGSRGGGLASLSTGSGRTESVGGDRTGDGRDVVVRRIRFVRSVGRVVFGGIGEEGPTGERRLRVAHVRGDESERLATKEGVIDELEDHEHVDAHEIHSGVHLRLELIAGHEAPEEVEGVAHQPLGEEPRGEALGGLEAEILDELGDLRDQPARDGGEPEVETHRVRGRVHAVREVQTYLRAGWGGRDGLSVGARRGGDDDERRWETARRVRREGRKRTQSTAPSWAHAHPLDIARLPDRGPRPGRAAVLALSRCREK